MGDAAASLGDLLQRLDRVLRTWATAGVLLLVLALVLAAATLLGR
jgi:hypothetical protein